MVDNIDIISIGEGLIELSTSESLKNANTLEKSYGGDTISTIVAASKLGSKVGYITKVGTDLFKDFLMDSWQAENIDLSYLKLVDGYNGLYILSKQKSGEKEFAYYRKKSAASTLSVEDLPAEYIKSASIIYSSGITQSLSATAKEAVKKSFEMAKQNDCTVAYDPNYRSRLWSLEEANEALEEVVDLVDIIFLNSKYDAEKLLELKSPDKIIKYFWDKGVPIVVIKMGSEGVAIGYNGETTFVPAFDVDPVDTTGAGDAFNGGFLHAIANGLTPFEAAKIASIVAKFKIQGIGATVSLPTKSQVYEEYKKNN